MRKLHQESVNCLKMQKSHQPAKHKFWNQKQLVYNAVSTNKDIQVSD